MKFWITLTFITATVFSVSVNSAVINYDENIDGDLQYRHDIGTLDIGINTISGSTGPLEGNLFDYDDIYFTIQEGHQVDQIFLTYTQTGYISVSYALVTYLEPNGYLEEVWPFGIRFGDDFPVWFHEFTPSGTEILSYFDFGILESDSYNLAHSGGSYDTGSSLQYTWEIHVSSVPVPASGWLFFSGLMTLVGFTRYKKTRKPG